MEGIVARKKNRAKAKMKSEELARFVDDAIPGFEGITDCKPDKWAERVKQIRDQKISHSDPTSTVTPDGRDIHVMTNVLYTAGTSFLLKEMGLGTDQIQQHIRGCRRSLLLKD